MEYTEQHFRVYKARPSEKVSRVQPLLRDV
nr:MAG TPA: hypothetical protein [Caudoviricetes sp.]